MHYDFLVVGCGFSGSTIAERLSSKGKKVLMIDKRNHIGGNAYDEYNEIGVLIHKYGPHIFHTNSKIVFDYLSQFTEWIKYEHKVVAFVDGKYVPVPVNRNTINIIYGLDLKTDESVANYLDKERVNLTEIKNAKDNVISKIGIDLYKKIFEGYTKKQWGVDPEELSPEITKRIPVRTNNDDRYFTDIYQYMPKNGYTELIKNMLSNKNIQLVLNTDFKKLDKNIEYDNLVYTGPIDYFFDYKFGRLKYRSLRFEFENFENVHHQKYPTINYPSKEVKYTRSTEITYITSQRLDKTTIIKEYPSNRGEEFYPVLTENDQKLYQKYKNEANKLQNVFFVGRLADFKYYNMDQAVAAALELSKKLV